MPEPESNAAVFLSYAREDTAAARRIADALRGFGVEVWFDQNELRGGDTWDQKIRGQIRTCALFMPVISANTQARAEGYFRREWKVAVERTHDMADGIPFIVPVVVDATAESAALVPEQFMRVQWSRLAGGMPTPEFVAQVKRLLDPERRTAAAITKAATATAPGTAPTASRGRLIAVLAGFAVVAVGAAVYLAVRPAGREQSRVSGGPPAPVVTANPPPPSPAAPKVAEKSIAVLPFANMSEDKEASAFFADGVHEDILTNLALIRDLKVVSRTTATQYRDSKKTLRQIGEELGVAYILEGSVRRAGKQVRVTGQLINARTDEHVWAKSYNKELTDIFTIQAELATEIATALQAAISPEAKKLLAARPTENLAAYDLYLKARALSRVGVSPQAKREALLQSAVELDAQFAPAWAELAITHGYIFRDQDHTPARLAKADAAAARAVQLAPEAPATFLASGFLANLGHRDWPRAIAEFEKILRLQPNNAEAIYAIATVQKRQGRWSESLANHRRAQGLDPAARGLAWDFARLLRGGRRWDEAKAAQRHYAAVASNSSSTPRPHGVLELEYWASGSTTMADEWIAGLTPEQRESLGGISVRKWRAMVSGDFAEWRRLDGLKPEADESEASIRLPAEEVVEAAMFMAANGDLAGARQRLGSYPAETRAKLELDPGNDRLWAVLASLEVVLGRYPEALRAARRAVELVPESIDANTGPRYARILAIVYAWSGEKDRAITELTRLARVPYGIDSVHVMRVDPAFAPLRGDPRFKALLNDPKNHAPLF